MAACILYLFVVGLMVDHPRSVTVGLSNNPIFRLDLIYIFEDIAIFRFGRLGLK